MLTRPLVMVVHGPDIFDLGYVRWLIENVRPQRTIVSGVMARTAAEESGLLLEFAGRPPSSVLQDLEGPAFLANCGKTQESGQIFGRIIAGRMLPAGLVHLECIDRTIYAWNDADFGLAGFLSRATGFPVERCTAIPDVDMEGFREIRGCIPGEPVFVNGLVIGTATAVTVVIRGREGRIEPVSGLHPKPHGFEKLSRLGPVSPARAWCKSGVVRRRNPRDLYEIKSAFAKGRVIVIDHCGHDLYQNLDEDVVGVLAIGDDTTSVCGHMCAHRGIPVFGIIDGDADGVIAPEFAPGSVVIRVASGHDDEFGREVSDNIPGGPVEWAAWVHAQVTFIGDRGTVMYPEEYPR
ncbi:MAG: DUF2117 domain-containing protein [Methanomicrobiales archaeon]|nr:DUF2117 domain-containing protein [Methanomicrobiales archaeon]